MIKLIELLLLDFKKLHLAHGRLFRSIISLIDQIAILIVVKVILLSSYVAELCDRQVVISCHYCSLCSFPFDFTLILFEIEFDHFSLARWVLPSVHHHSKVNVKGITRKFIKWVVHQLENQHVTNVKTFFFEGFNTLLELFHSCLETSYCSSWSTYLKNRVLNIVFVFTAVLLENFHDKGCRIPGLCIV